MTEGHALAHHFESLEQQRETASVGMWAFLAQEVMFFGGAFCAYIVFRSIYPAGFVEGGSHLDVTLGMVNTIVLIGSSLTMAIAVREAQQGRGRTCALFLGATAALALVFLGIKAVEYNDKWSHGLVPGLAWDASHATAPGVGLYFCLYFFMTGLHALHMIVGLPLMAFVARRALEGAYSPENHIGVETLGLYWHFVDLIWIFLFPLFYLIE